ncbi:MAG: hypothetical protein HFJ12_00820 [Bacilli bacterium]|nr:hypothetical protein [Bacilli bacterium]
MEYILIFDIAKNKNAYCFIDSLKNIIIDSALIVNKKDDFDNLYNIVKHYNNLIVIMESTSISFSS